jgi:hypothetical protein
MNRFTYTLPSGKRFTMTTPDSVTQIQADAIFYGQVAAGALAGFVAGQTKSTLQTQAVKFLLSRLDRGTAGVDDRVILSIVSGIPNITGLPNLINVPLENPITQGDLANIGFDNSYTAPAIGPLNSSQVQGLLAQIANYVAQAPDVMTDTTGVGQYGFDCQQLEQSGYVKPGTYREFIFDPSPLTSVLSAPGIWTGRNGINSATEFLNNPVAQNDAMATLLQQSYTSLTANGTITPPFAPPVTAAVGQVFTQSGLQTVSRLSAATGISLPVPTNLVPVLSNTNISSLISTPLTNVGSLASGALNNFAGGSLPNVSSIASSLSNTVTGGVAALVSNGSIFGTSAVTQWAKSGSLDQLLTGGGGIGGALTSGVTSLTNNIAGLNVLGKASQFASGFSNPLTSLSNLGNFNISSLTSGLPDIGSLSNLSSTLTGSLSGLSSNLTGSLTGLVSGQLSSITGALSGQLGSLTSSLGSLGNFGSLASLPGLGSLGDIGGLFGGGGDALVSSVQVAPGYSNTVNRAEVDVAFGKILGSAKIPRPSFDYSGPGSASLGANGDIAFAQNALKALQGAGNRILELGTTVFNPNETASA